MNDDRFIVSKAKGEDGYTIVSARLPQKLVERLDEAAKKSNRNRNQLITLALDFALRRLEIVNESDQTSSKTSN